MARKPDPLRIYAARRAGLFSRLVAESRLSEHRDGFWPWWQERRR